MMRCPDRRARFCKMFIRREKVLIYILRGMLQVETGDFYKYLTKQIGITIFQKLLIQESFILERFISETFCFLRKKKQHTLKIIFDERASDEQYTVVNDSETDINDYAKKVVKFSKTNSGHMVQISHFVSQRWWSK